MIQPPEITAKLNLWRDKAKDGVLTQEEMKEAIVLMRQGRYSACFASKAARAKKLVEELPTAEQLIEEISLIGCITSEDIQ